MNIRNIAIIAHVDHGKTTLVDGLLKQSKMFRANEAVMGQELIMDSNDQERERGITILAKNTAIIYHDNKITPPTEYKINIIDTPGHADFGGEVERTINMADGALLIIDAQEGPMPQTKFVLKKAFKLGLKVIVIINKIDKKDAQVDKAVAKTHDLFLDLATRDVHLDFPVYYAVGREAKAWEHLPKDFNESADLTPIFDAIIKYVPQPKGDLDKPFQMQITTLDWDNFKGKYAIGRVFNGFAIPLMPIILVNNEGKKEKAVIDKVYVSRGLKRVEVEKGLAGDIIAVTGIKNAAIGDTVCDPKNPSPLTTLEIEKPTLKMVIGPNTSPFAGREGKFVTSRQILERIQQELQTNVSLHLETNETGEFVLSGRGELHLSVFLETLRRESFEMQIGKPQVITKKINGKEMEPVEELTIDVAAHSAGAVTSEIGKRRGVLISQEELTDQSARLVFEITTRGLIGLRSVLLTISKGTAIMSSTFLKYQPMSGEINQTRKGVLVASETGKTTAYGLNNVQERGITFVGPQTQVYEGMIIGLNAKDEDIEVNACREKQLTNNRSSGETGFILSPPTILSLEQSIGFLENDELLEITPKSLRLRKKILNANMRNRAKR